MSATSADAPFNESGAPEFPRLAFKLLRVLLTLNADSVSRFLAKISLLVNLLE